MRYKVLIGTAAVLSLALAACNENTVADGDSRDQVATTEPAPAPTTPTIDPTTAKDASGIAGKTPTAEFTAETREYVQKAAMGDLYEIEASKVALARSQSADVKEFAQQMVDAHMRSSDELKARLARAGQIVELPTMLDAEHQKMLDDLKAASPRTFDARYAAQQKEAHDQALMLHRDYAMRGAVADLKAFAADIVPKVEMHVQMAAELQSDHRTG
jgi:putative membrane protein